jgi:cytochrome o ubiquinol oxidase subunit 1
MMWFMCFVATFTIGGVTGVMMAVPAIDFQVHNSMFLVAHFHNTIIGGVVFGYLAGITYWFPKVMGFRLYDKLGKISAYFWQVGFILAFVPLYILGLMGAVRRINHYDDPSWQPLFIVSAIGVVTIGIGIAVFVLQLAYSVLKRHELRDTTGDPWDGRTLEWSVPSPAPHYNFAITPTVSRIDEWWYQKKDGLKQLKHSDYQDIYMPKNTGLGIAIGAAVGLAGFALIWHIWWLAFVSVAAAISCTMYRGMQDDVEYKITAQELYEHDRKARA